MDPITDDPDVPSILDDSETWSGSEDPAGPYFSQDEAYYGETESDTELHEGQESSHALDHGSQDLLEHNPESSFSECSREDDPQCPVPDLDPDYSVGKNKEPPLRESTDQDSQSHSSSPLPNSGCSVPNHTDQRHSGSCSSYLDELATSPRSRKQLARENSNYLESEDEQEGGDDGEGGGGEEEEEEGGGEREAAPPVSSVLAGIQTLGAEQSEQWGKASLPKTNRAGKQWASHTRQRRSEGQSEKHLREAKSKCKRIALLLTAAPNPESKGVLMFKKRRQRVRKFTLVSYGTGKPLDESFENEYGFEDNSIGRDLQYSQTATSESEFEEDYGFSAQGHCAALNFNFNSQEQGISAKYYWEDMEQLPQTKGKGVLMFAQRRQRIDEITAEHEEMRSKGIPVEAYEPEIPAKPLLQEEVAPVQPAVQDRQQLLYQEQQYQQQMFQEPNIGINGLDPYQLSSQSKTLVANRTAKPFMGGRNQVPATFSPIRGVPGPTPKKADNIFKVSVPVNTSPQVWSPTGDIIASRDERIAVPAIKTGILPEAKRRGTNKTNSKEPLEEDYMSLGAEACNFMQAPTVRQKNPPPVLPKPTIDPTCPPWSAEGRAPHSPLPASGPVPAHLHSAPPPPQQQQQQWTPPHPQVATKPWAPSPIQPAPQQPMSGWAAPNSSTAYQSSWASGPQQAPVSIQTPTTSHAVPSQSKVSWTKIQNDANSVASCPPQRGSTYFHASKAPAASPRGQTSETELSSGSGFKGKGAELFARRQSRMEKFVVDAETVQANKARAPSPTMSMPSTWKYSSNIRAPPPVSYNPIVSPFYPLAAQKHAPPATSPKTKSKTTQQKPTPAIKHLSAVDVMKHQPYQLDSALFTYNSIPEMKSASPKPSPIPPAESKRTSAHTPTHLQAPTSGHFQTSTLSPSPVPSTGSVQSLKQGAAAKSSGPVSVPYPFTRQSEQAEAAPAPQLPHGKTSAPPTMHEGPSSKISSSLSTPLASTAFNTSMSPSSFPFSTEMISRSALPVAPRPKFTARKAAVGAKQWKPVIFSRSRSMSLPRRLSSVSAMSPVSSPGLYPARSPLERHMSWVEHPQKPPSPWEAAARSPLGLVDEAFGPQNIQQSISSSVNAAAHRKSLPEPPLEWKRRVSNDDISFPTSTKASAPIFQKPIVHGPPFRPAQPLMSFNRYTGTSSLPRNFSSYSNYAQAHRVSWKM